jgi:hypothetical protein
MAEPLAGIRIVIADDHDDTRDRRYGTREQR